MCRCPQGFTGMRCEFQDVNLDLTRRILESEDGPLAEHGFAHVIDPASSSLMQTVVGEEGLMDRIRRSSRADHSLVRRFPYSDEKDEFSSEDERIKAQNSSKDTKSEHSQLSSLLSKILRIKRHQLKEKYERLLEYSQQSPVR